MNDVTLWATALYGGLRRGELQALQESDIDLEQGVIHVRRSWDDKESVIETKSRAGTRTVPIASILRSHLLAHHLRRGRPATGLVFGRSPTQPFSPSSVRLRALSAWRNAPGGPLTPIGLHECRRTFASLMIAAGVNAKALSTYLGHSSIQITLDRYGHLMPATNRKPPGSSTATCAPATTSPDPDYGPPTARSRYLIVARACGKEAPNGANALRTRCRVSPCTGSRDL